MTFGLGIDAGGTQTRWALARASGEIVAEGAVAGLSGLQMDSEAGRLHLQATFGEIAKGVAAFGPPQAVYAGFTGLGEAADALRTLISTAIAVEPRNVRLGSDIEIAYLDVYAPGEGYVVYAGTGSVAAFIDADGALHRAGGRGVLLDDAGGGFWIAKEALRHIWRREDERPESWRESPMAVAVFARLGGSDWAVTRQFVYGTASAAARGEIGRLALAVAAAADADPAARHILEAAGRELARLGQAMILRFGARPITLSGRATQLHPLIFSAMQAALPLGTALTMKVSDAHYAAARIAAKKCFA